MYGHEFCKSIGVDVWFHTISEVTIALKKFNKDVYVFCLGADVSNINDGRTIKPTRMKPVINPNWVKHPRRGSNCCPITLVKYKKDGNPCTTGVTIFGSTCKTDGDEIQIFTSYEDCVNAWNNRVNEVIKLKLDNIEYLNKQVVELTNIKM